MDSWRRGMCYTRTSGPGVGSEIMSGDQPTDEKIQPLGERRMTGSIHLTQFGVAAALGTALAVVSTAPSIAWEPTRTVEIIVPAGPGGGADQMARVVQGIVTKHKLMNQSMVVINKAGGAGGEGFLDVKGSRGNPHK